MPDYNGQQFDPPTPVALVAICAINSAHCLSDIAMLIDSGADVTLIPRECAEKLGLKSVSEAPLRLQGFDGGTVAAKVVEAELVFLGRSFRGRFPLVEEEWGIIGRNVLNSISLVLDGPHLNWREETAAK